MKVISLIALIISLLFFGCDSSETSGAEVPDDCSPDCAQGTHQEGCECVENCTSNTATIIFTNNMSEPMKGVLLSGNDFVLESEALAPGATSQEFTFNVPNGSYEFHTGFMADPCDNIQFGCPWKCSYPLETIACGRYEIGCP